MTLTLLRADAMTLSTSRSAPPSGEKAASTLSVDGIGCDGACRPGGLERRRPFGPRALCDLAQRVDDAVDGDVAGQVGQIAGLLARRRAA
jgi:hypothetical protein